MGWAWDQCDLTPTQKFVLVALADMAGDEDYRCYPSYKHLSLKKTGYTQRTIREAVAALEKAGKITRVRRPKRSNLWRVNVKGEVDASLKEEPAKGESDAPKGEHGSSRGESDYRSGGNEAPPESLHESLPQSSEESLAPVALPQEDFPEFKPPADNAGPTQKLSYFFCVLRREQDGDRFWDPWNEKHLAQCRHIIERMAGNNLEEVKRRLGNLLRHYQLKPNYYRLEPGGLQSNWSDCNKSPDAAPTVRNIGEAALRAYKESLMNEVAA